MHDPESLDEFGKRLMISTLFHEVGHALGLDHNFKGSLAFDGTQPAGEHNPTSWSVMDYNYYQNEMDLFHEIGGSEGPALEYDRQIISQLYSQGSAVKANDSVVPACNDAEADDARRRRRSAVRPLRCEKRSFSGRRTRPPQPRQRDGRDRHRSQDPCGDGRRSERDLHREVRFATEVPSLDALNQTASELGSKVGSLAGYFIASGAQSLRVNVRNNAKALRAWQDGVELDEATFRGRYIDVLKQAVALRGLPDAPNSAVQSLTAAVKAAAASNPALGSTDGDRTVNATKAAALFSAAIDAKVKAALSRVRQDVYTNLNFDLTSPFALAMSPGGELSHFEELAADTLVAGTLNGLSSGSPDLQGFAAERALAATSLVSFRGVSPTVRTTVPRCKRW